MAVTSASWIVARTAAELSRLKIVCAVEMMLTAMVTAAAALSDPPPVATPTDTANAQTVWLLSAVTEKSPAALSEARRSVPMIPAWVVALSWLNPIEAPTPLAPEVTDTPPPIEISCASSLALSLALPSVATTLAPSMMALVVSTMRLTETEPENALPCSLVLTATPAVNVASVPPRCAVSETALPLLGSASVALTVSPEPTPVS